MSNKIQRYNDAQLTKYSQNRRYVVLDLLKQFISEIDDIINEGELEVDTNIDKIDPETINKLNTEFEKIDEEIKNLLIDVESFIDVQNTDLGVYIDFFNSIIGSFNTRLNEILIDLDKPEVVKRGLYNRIYNSMIESYNTYNSEGGEYNTADSLDSSIYENQNAMDYGLVPIRVNEDQRVVEFDITTPDSIDKYRWLFVLQPQYTKNDITVNDTYKGENSVFAIEIIIKSLYQEVKAIVTWSYLGGATCYVDYSVADDEHIATDFKIGVATGKNSYGRKYYFNFGIFISTDFSIPIKVIVKDILTNPEDTFDASNTSDISFASEPYSNNIGTKDEWKVGNVTPSQWNIFSEFLIKPNTFGSVSTDLNINKVSLEYCGYNDMKVIDISLDVDGTKELIDATETLDDEDNNKIVESLKRNKEAGDFKGFGPQFLYLLFKDILRDRRIYNFFGSIRIDGRLYKVSYIRIRKATELTGTVEFFLEDDQKLPDFINNLEVGDDQVYTNPLNTDNRKKE